MTRYNNVNTSQLLYQWRHPIGLTTSRANGINVYENYYLRTGPIHKWTRDSSTILSRAPIF